MYLYIDEDGFVTKSVLPPTEKDKRAIEENIIEVIYVGKANNDIYVVGVPHEGPCYEIEEYTHSIDESKFDNSGILKSDPLE